MNNLKLYDTILLNHSDFIGTLVQNDYLLFVFFLLKFEFECGE